MIVFITGARRGVDPKELSRLIELSDFDITTVVTSDRGGVDEWAREWALRSDKHLVVVSAQWERHGNDAARMRNIASIEMSSAMILFGHRTCQHCLVVSVLACNADIPVYIQTLKPL